MKRQHVFSHMATARPPGTLRPSPLRQLLLVAVAIEAFFLALMAVAPLDAVTQTISPLARTWPWLLAPARFIFGAARLSTHTPAPVDPRSPASTRSLFGAVLPRAHSAAEQGWPALALFAALLVGASGVAALALPICRRCQGADRRHLALALGGAALLGATLVLLPSLPSDDIFSYILYGRISVVHGANPLIAVPSAFPNDPFLRLVFWRGTRSVYGPFWLLLSAGLTHIAQALGGSLPVYVLLFKLTGWLAHLANTALIWAILGILAPRRRLLGTLLYAWNPLCLLEFCASAHNDAVMLTFALLGIYCLVRPSLAGYGRQPRARWELLALVAFGLSISTKYVLLALLPFYLVSVARQALDRHESLQQVAGAVAWRLGVVLGVVALTALPYWDGPRTLGSILYSPPTQQLDNSLLEGLQWPLRALAQALGMARPGAASLVQSGLKILGLLAFLAIWLWHLRRVRDLNSMLHAWAWVLFWYAVVASGWFWPWYVTWTIALVALLPWNELSVAALMLAGGVLTLYAFLPLYAAPVYGLRAWLAFVPALGYLAWRRWAGKLLVRLRETRKIEKRASNPKAQVSGRI